LLCYAAKVAKGFELVFCSPPIPFGALGNFLNDLFCFFLFSKKKKKIKGKKFYFEETKEKINI